MKKEDCQKCYTCESGVPGHITIDDIKSGKYKQGKEGSSLATSENCKVCYTCEKVGESTLSMGERCKVCYTCEKVGEQVVEKKGGSQVITVGGDKKRKAEACRVCYFCEQGVDKTKSVEDMPKKGQVPYFIWYVFPTNGCNLRCDYCYANNKPGKMTKETMHKTLRFLFEKQEQKEFSVHFFGGEPTTMWDMLVDTVQLGNEMAKLNKRKVRWGMTTNGTLLNREKLEFIKKHFKVNQPFLLSIDGRPETHDIHRVLPGKKPSHHLIPVDMILDMFPNLEVRPTIKPDTAKDWFEDFRWLRNKGFKSIAIEADYESPWSPEQIQDYENTLREVGKYWLYAQRAGKPFYAKYIDSVRHSLQRQTEAPGGRMCGVAFNCGAIDHRGLLYACQRYASYNDPEKFAMGDVEKGFDEYKLFKTQALTREHVSGDISAGYNCATCGIRRFCHKGCNAANIKIMGAREIALPRYCELSKVEVRVALEILSELGILRATEEQKQCSRC